MRGHRDYFRSVKDVCVSGQRQFSDVNGVAVSKSS